MGINHMMELESGPFREIVGILAVGFSARSEYAIWSLSLPLVSPKRGALTRRSQMSHLLHVF